MKKSQFLNYFLFRYKETINVKDSDFFKSIEFSKSIRDSKYFNQNKSENGFFLEYTDDINVIRVFPNFLIKLHLKSKKMVEVKVAYSKYFLWIYIFACLSVFIGFIIDLLFDVSIGGGISDYPLILIIFPIFLYAFLLLFFSFLLHSCLKELKKLLV